MIDGKPDDRFIGMLSGALGMCFSGLLIWQVLFKWRQQNHDANALVWQRLLVSLSTCDFMQGLYYVLNYFDKFANAKGGLCEGFAFLGMYFACASFFFTANISWFIYEAVQVEYIGRTRLSSRLTWFCWGYPLFVDGILLIWDNTSKHGGAIGSGEQTVDGIVTRETFGCFINPIYKTWRVMTIYLPLWSCWVFTLCTYYLTVRRIRHLLNATTSFAGDSKNPSLTNRLADIQRKLVLIPVVFVFLRMWETIYRIVEFSHKYENPETFRKFEASHLGRVLANLQALCNPAQGVLNCFIFVVLSPKFDLGCGACTEPLHRWWQNSCGGGRAGWRAGGGGGGGNDGAGGVDKAHLLGYSAGAAHTSRISRSEPMVPTSSSTECSSSSSSSSSAAASSSAWNESDSHA
jgi:hypothetical protein